MVDDSQFVLPVDVVTPFVWWLIIMGNEANWFVLGLFLLEAIIKFMMPVNELVSSDWHYCLFDHREQLTIRSNSPLWWAEHNPWFGFVMACPYKSCMLATCFNVPVLHVKLTILVLDSWAWVLSGRPLFSALCLYKQPIGTSLLAVHSRPSKCSTRCFHN